ncbi:hypothetical protein NBRC10513_002786 [Rhodotorula toruloides]
MERLAAIHDLASEVLSHPVFAPFARRSTLVPPSSEIKLPHPDPLDIQLLIARGCTPHAAQSLDVLYRHTCARLETAAGAAFSNAVAEMTVASGGDEAYQPFEEAMRASICRVFQRRTSDFRQRLFEEVRAAQLRHSLSPPAPPSPESPATGRPKQFTAEVLAILEAAFEASDSVSRGERRELANVTGLTERQVLTWFANQRQRRNKKKERRVPGTPYVRPDLAVPSTPTSRIRAPMHVHQQRRTVSGSSLGSSGSSLVEYAEQDLVLPPLDPSVQQPLFLPDVPVLGDVTAPTPIAATFFATPSSSRFDCSASSVSSSLDDFSIPQPPRAAYDPSSLFSTSPSNASTSSFDLPPLDAPFEPAIVQAPAPTDAWMDDEFYRNLFGSLGLDAGEGAGVKLEGGEGGGLTLSLDAVRAELEGMQGVEADLSFLF